MLLLKRILTGTIGMLIIKQLAEAYRDNTFHRLAAYLIGAVVVSILYWGMIDDCGMKRKP